MQHKTLGQFHIFERRRVRHLVTLLGLPSRLGGYVGCESAMAQPTTLEQGKYISVWTAQVNYSEPDFRFIPIAPRNEFGSCDWSPNLSGPSHQEARSGEL
jgi:hypothetical protein